mmetsp:Transcript_8316/g.18015  ORF Transcript_8316/g.18015 Transcript_8316/m.18015 type:complete len:248 (+) Transcript_8316:1063-1806(+)
MIFFALFFVQHFRFGLHQYLHLQCCRSGSCLPLIGEFIRMSISGAFPETLLDLLLASIWTYFEKCIALPNLSQGFTCEVLPAESIELAQGTITRKNLTEDFGVEMESPRERMRPLAQALDVLLHLLKVQGHDGRLKLADHPRHMDCPTGMHPGQLPNVLVDPSLDPMHILSKPGEMMLEARGIIFLQCPTDVVTRGLQMFSYLTMQGRHATIQGLLRFGVASQVLLHLQGHGRLVVKVAILASMQSF